MRTLKIFGICTSLLLVLTAMTNPVKAEEAVINTEILNVRSGPGQTYDEITEVHVNETYPILQRQDNWVEIQLDSMTGWITTEYITVQKEKTSNNEADQASKQSSIDEITIPYENTHLRSGPSTEYEIVGFAKKGTSFDVLGETEDWYEVKHEDLKGFLKKQFVKDAADTVSRGIENKTIVIDAGHGGRDVGAIGASGTYEKDYAYKTSLELKQELTVLGANVLLTRPKDEFISLGSRSSYANIAADAFISIHYNSTPALPNVTGIGTYYYHGQNKDLASYVQKELIKETGADDRGIAYGDFYVIRQTFKPAILVELGFISNQEMEQLLQTNAYQKKLVQGMVNGLLKYFGNN
ncbi:N-acetylmuramoyl-L-alanine amidase [Virgibacillus necropolis]|uniref:N-acetylmuramoyl-L-alanine amidase n=1 Tax=Virgibacillus necropolis TaxID=163877 RepID=UPI00384ACB12